MELRIVNSQPGACLAAVDGEMNIYAAGGLKESLGKLAAGCQALEIDLSAVTDIDSAGLQLMLMTKRLPGCTVRFINHSLAVLQLLELSRLDRAVGDPLVLAPDLAEAI